MKLFRHGVPGCELPGVYCKDGTLRDVSHLAGDYNELFFARGGLAKLAAISPAELLECPVLRPDVTRLGSCIARPSKIICVGKNYLEHAKEFGEGVPAEPILFLKATSSMSGPNDDVQIPVGGTQLDYEIELGVVIGKRAKNIREDQAGAHIAGYTLFNDYSERFFQKHRGGQWTKGKSCDTFGPTGPFLVTPDEIPNPQALRLWLKVNGEFRQNGYTGDMMWQVHYLVSYISQFMTLLPGDLIATGTPSGVAMGMNPPAYLHAGDLVQYGSDLLGECQQRVLDPAR